MNRFLWMDITRALAIFLVLLIHVTDEIFSKFNFDDIQWNIYQLIKIIGRIGVPLFLMLSGALILPVKGGFIGFYRKRIPQFIFVLVAYSTLTNFIYNNINSEPFSFIDQLRSVISGNTEHAYQLWYMYVIIAIYILAPFITKTTLYIGDRNTLLILISASSLAFIATTTKAIFPDKMQWFKLPPIHYVTYFMLGYFISKKGFMSKVKINKLLMIFTITFAITIIIQNKLYLPSKSLADGVTWYTSIFTLIMSSTVFLMLSKLNLRANEMNFITNTSKYSFGIFLFHLIPLFIALQFTSVINNSVIRLLVCFISCYLLSYFFVAIISKAPYIKKLVV